MDNKEMIETNGSTPPVSENLRQSLRILQKHSVLFAHHSVGENILNGLRTLSNEAGVDIAIVNIADAREGRERNIIEFSPGKNTDPKSKVDGFAEQVNRIQNDGVPNVAFLKFCYIDLTPDTDTEDLLAYYKKNIDSLKEKKTDIRFAHFTVPLTTRPTDFKSRIKRLLGMQVWGDASNVSRGKFNELLYKTFPDDPIFDIARIESTRPDGSRTNFTHNDKVYYSLAQEYTNDGGHLNSLGKRIVAEKFARFIANIFTNK